MTRIRFSFILKTVMEMQINYNRKKLEDMARKFYNATGANICILDKDFSPLIEVGFHTEYCKKIHCSKKGKACCEASDKRMLLKARETKKEQTHICHAGLMDASVPIFFEREIIGYIILGELKYTECFPDKEGYLRSLGLDPDRMKKLYDKLPLYTPEKVSDIASIAAMLTGYILMEKMIRPDTSNKKERIISYIEDNLLSELSIQKICEDTGISKNVLYRCIRENFGCTVSSYINRKRVETACRMLRDTELSIERISRKCCFSSTSYFTRTFKKEMGITPVKYRRT